MSYAATFLHKSHKPLFESPLFALSVQEGLGGCTQLILRVEGLSGQEKAGAEIRVAGRNHD
jgi:hypothetical protein